MGCFGSEEPLLRVSSGLTRPGTSVVVPWQQHCTAPFAWEDGGRIEPLHQPASFSGELAAPQAEFQGGEFPEPSSDPHGLPCSRLSLGEACRTPPGGCV